VLVVDAGIPASRPRITEAVVAIGADVVTYCTQEGLKELTAPAVIQRLLLGALDLNAAPHKPGGCLMVQGALSAGEAGDSIRQKLPWCRAASEAALRRRHPNCEVQRRSWRTQVPSVSLAILPRSFTESQFWLWMWQTEIN
jgi:hypothetical protein